MYEGYVVTCYGEKIVIFTAGNFDHAQEVIDELSLLDEKWPGNLIVYETGEDAEPVENARDIALHSHALYQQFLA